MTELLSNEEMISMVVSKYKTRACHCELTNHKCLASSAKSNRPTVSMVSKLCRSYCPWGMKWQPSVRL
jgi:hypothetical protein